MYGSRAKIGIIIPSNNTVIEPELWAMRSPGVTIHGARVLSYGNTPEGIVKMEQSAMRAAGELGAGAMSVIVYACLATSLVKGHIWNDKIAAQIKANNGIPVTTAATATIEALRSVGAKTLGIANAYPTQINDLVRGYFEKNGFAVSSLESLNIENSLELWRLSPETLYDLGMRALRPSIDAICILATDLPTISIIERLEEAAGIPVITTNQAVLWHSLKLLGLKADISGFGRLVAQSDM